MLRTRSQATQRKQLRQAARLSVRWSKKEEGLARVSVTSVR
jgi:hypothetical protein